MAPHRPYCHGRKNSNPCHMRNPCHPPHVNHHTRGPPNPRRDVQVCPALRPPRRNVDMRDPDATWTVAERVTGALRFIPAWIWMIVTLPSRKPRELWIGDSHAMSFNQ